MLVTNKLNQLTINANFSLALKERSERDYRSVWIVKLNDEVINYDWWQSIPAGTEFIYYDLHDAEEDEVREHLASYGILKACGISQSDAERLFEDYEEGE